MRAGTAARIVLLGAVLAGIIAVVAYGLYVRPGPLAEDATVIVEKGDGVREIGERLAGKDVVPSAPLFALAVRFIGAHTDLKAGEFQFPARVSMAGAIALLREGDTVQRRVTIPEGLTSQQIVNLIGGVEGLSGSIETVPAEGTLLPETYHFTYGEHRSDLIERMEEYMRETVAELWPNRAEGLPLENAEEAVVLASIVEKETALAHERPRVAAVFINRLRIGMRLQADPTVVYGIAGGVGAMDRPLTRKDLQTPSPFNTYVIAGLPPEPIANPGRASISAVLAPLDSDELYFVADGSGGHVFARTLKEHNDNVARWRALRRSGNDASN